MSSAAHQIFLAEPQRTPALSKVQLRALLQSGAVQLFVYVQLLDFLTTLVGFRFGASEASPFIRLLMGGGPIFGVAVSKLVALALAAACVSLQKYHLIRWATYWYCGLIVWNLMIILASRQPTS